jgi:CMP/dCMP kinase
MMRRISIAGDIGSGKTTIASIIAKSLGVVPHSTGGIQRRLATSMGIDTIALNRLAEEDHSIDNRIDGYLRSLPSGPLVVESRMAWRFVPDTLRVFLYVVPQSAAVRILAASRGDENYRDIDEALRTIQDRRRSEIMRFDKSYGVNISDLRNYDLVIDTTQAPPEAVARKILDQASIPQLTECWISPQELFPTQSIRQLDPKQVSKYGHLMIEPNVSQVAPISTLYVGHAFFILDGHARVAAAAKSGLLFVPAFIAATDNQEYIPGLSARDYVDDAVSDSLIYDWEDAVGLKFEYPIWRSDKKRSAPTLN